MADPPLDLRAAPSYNVFMEETSATRGADDILDISLRAGTMVLQNGGETYRAEETMLSVARSLGSGAASAFVTPTVAMLTCLDASLGGRTRIQRITERSINLGKIARVNEFVRRLAARPGASDLGAVSTTLRRIDAAGVHGPIGVTVATALSALFFALMFRGSARDALAALAVGALTRASLYALAPLSLSPFFLSVIGGFAISFLSGLAVYAGLVPSPGTVSISVLMALVPGLAIVNAIRDTIAGDLVAGSARLLEAFVVAAALSLGGAFAIALFPVDPGYVSAVRVLREAPFAFALSFLATGSFAYFFSTSRYDILWASFFGAVGWTVYLAIRDASGSEAAAYMAGALSVGLLSEAAAVLLRKPATVFIVPGIIPLVPGGGMYETMLYSVLGRGEEAATAGFRALTAAAAIAVGIALASSLARLTSRFRTSRPRI
jgi:uncharacterized membrane protein YjjP (DUF1212 family)